MLKLWTTGVWEQSPTELANAVNRFRRQVELATFEGKDAPFVEDVTYLGTNDYGLMAFIDYYAEEELMPE